MSPDPRIDGPPPLIDRTSGPVDAAALEAAYSLAEDGKGQVHSFHFEEKLTSKVIKATVDSPKGDKWFATVEAPEIPNAVFVTAYKLNKDDRSKGGEADRLPSPVTGLPKIYALDKGDAIYVVASSGQAATTVVAKVTAFPLESNYLKSSAEIAVAPQTWGRAICNITLNCTGELISNGAMRKRITEDSSLTNYKHVQILSPEYVDPTEINLAVDYKLSKGSKYRHQDDFGYGPAYGGYVDVMIDNPRLEVTANSGKTTMSGLSGTVRVPVAKGRTPSVKVNLVLDVKTDFYRTLKDGGAEKVKSDSSGKMSLLVVDLHGGG